ncbi:MAG: DNA topoisomerase IV subunit A [Pseudomonadota bacterium]
MATKSKDPRDPTPPHQSVIEQPLAALLSERYLAYALSTITSRSLPDVRDGLKPVHRRLLYAMYQLRLMPELGPKKSARVVGDVIGKFHPHGDQSVYDALVRLAQDFAVRYPLVDGQGNFGNIDGDNAAAMRYTEAKLTPTAIRLLQDIDRDAADMRPTYDGETLEPTVMPAAFPNLLANGSSGIAVGMATNIPPHNVAEICQALLLLIDKSPSLDDILAVMPAPDFPTGGVLVENATVLRQAYATGRGSMRVRARWEQEDLKQGLYQIVVTEIPYQVQKSKLVEQIADLITTKKIPLLDDVRDESTEDIRLILVPKNRNVDPALLMEALFHHCDLETRFSLNMNVLDEGGRVPRVMALPDVLRAWLNHRQDVLLRVSHHRLGELARRLEILAGYRIAYLNLDEVIRIIREEDEVKQVLADTFGLTDMQAEAILNMRLRALRKLEEMEIKREYDTLANEQENLQAIVASEALQWKAIRAEVMQIAKEYAQGTPLGRRRTTIADAPPAVALNLQEALIEREPVTVVLSEKGWIRALKGHGLNADDIKYKEGDSFVHAAEVMTTDKLLLVSSQGRFYALGCDKLPSGRGFGEPLRLQIDLPQDAAIVTIMPYDPAQRFLLASSEGRGFVVKAEDCLAQTKNGRAVMGVDDPHRLQACLPLSVAHNMVAIIGQNRKLLCFKLEETPVMTKGKGVILQRYKDGSMGDIKTFAQADGLTWRTKDGKVSRATEIVPWLGNRAGAGKMPPTGFPLNNRF